LKLTAEPALFVFERKDGFPIDCHAYNDPAPSLRLVEALVELTGVALAVVGPFARGVGVMDVKARRAVPTIKKRSELRFSGLMLLPRT